MSGSSREALPDIRKWSEFLPRCPGVVESLSQIFGSG